MAPERTHFVRRGVRERVMVNHTAQHRPFLQRLMVWGCMSYSGVGPVLPVMGTLRQDEYVSILQQHMVPQMAEWLGPKGSIFQQDNAPCHKSRFVKAWMEKQPFQVMEWPPYSPDLSPIENLWAIVKTKVHEAAVTSKEELMARIWVIWHEDPSLKASCEALIEGMPRRVLACIRAKGGPLKY